MAYSLVNSYGTDFAVDWDIVERLCMSYWRARYQVQYSETTETSQRTWNPFSWAMPPIKTVDVDWDRVRQDAHVACIKDMFDYSRRAPKDMRGIAIDVKYKVEQTAVYKREFTSDLKDVQRANISAMQEAEGDYQGLIDASRFVRDTSADIVAIGSTIATGGAAAGLLGASSALKGVYKYQDTGSVGAAVLYGGGSLVVGYFKIGGKQVSQAGEAVLIIVQGATETATSWAAGDSFSKAAERGGLKIASAGAAQLMFGNSVVKEAFKRIPIPINVFARTPDLPPGMMVDVADKLLEKSAKKLTEKGVKAGIGAAFGGSDEGATATASSGVIDETPVENLGLLNFAIVNMKNGIGRGW